ncbi:exophilin-5 isoform X2 [Leptodactylus fuscus]|uniref:exophilin-5 isoform X2 n=1 Tax=Leptodactylus fuscus TaxID=238119 RepID=UPI003F4F3311
MSSLLPEPESSRMTTSQNFQPQKNSGPSFLGLRSPLSSLFSFRKSAKQNLKLPPQHERHGVFSVSGQIPTNTEAKKKFEIYNSARSVKQIANFFEAHHRARESSTTTTATQLENEVFQVLGDLDQKLAQEQSQKQTVRTSRLGSYKYGKQYSKEGLLHNTSEPKKVYSSLSSHDGRRPLSLEETRTTYATYQPRKFSEMYLNRQRSVCQQDNSNKSLYRKSPSLFSTVSHTSQRSTPSSGSFSSTSLQLLSPGIDPERTRQHKSTRLPVTSIKWNNALSSGQTEETGRHFRTQSAPSSGSFSSSSLQSLSPGIELERTRQHKSRRTPVTSIKWNNAPPNGQPVETGRPSRTQSALDLTNIGNSSRQSRVFDLYKIPSRVPVSASNEFNNITGLTNIAEDRSTGYYKTNAPVHRPEDRYYSRLERYREKNYRDNTKMSKTLNENSSGNDKKTEPVELKRETSVQPNATRVENVVLTKTEAPSNLSNFYLQTEDFPTKADERKMEVDPEESRNLEPDIHDEDIPVDCTLKSETKIFQDPNPLKVSSGHTSEPEIMDVDVPNIFVHSINTSSSTSVGHGSSAQVDNLPPKMERPGITLTDRNRPLDTNKTFSSFDHRTSYTIDTPSFKSAKLSAWENTKQTRSTDTGGRFAWMNRRRGSNGNCIEGFQSDTLMFKNRNASSLPDLLDQDNEILPNNIDINLLKKSCENVVQFAPTTVPETKSSSISHDSNYEKPSVQNTNPQPKNVSSKTFLQRPYTSYGSVREGMFKNLDKNTSYPAVPYESEKETKNHTEIFSSDTLMYTKKNASSLPDLLDQESDIFGNNAETILRKNSCELDGDLLETKPSKIPDERKEMYLGSSRRSEHSYVQDTIQEPKKSTLSTWKSLQKLSTFSFIPELDVTSMKTEKQTAGSEATNRADTMAETNTVKNFVNLTETTPFPPVYAKLKSVNFNKGQYVGQRGSDSNNNTQSIAGTQAINPFHKDDESRIQSGSSSQKQDPPKTEQVSKCETSSGPKISVLYERDVASSASQDIHIEKDYELQRNLNQTLIHQLTQEVNKNVEEYTEPPRVADSSRFPISQTLKEHLEENNWSRTTHLPTTENRSTTLLKQHAFVTPEPYKPNVHISVIPRSEWSHSTSSEDNQEVENLKDLTSENRSPKEAFQFQKTYTYQEVIENTEIYESLTDTSYPEVDKIEYRKVVSVYYTLPRKFSRRISDLSKNLKNIDKTLEQNSAPTALLDKISRWKTEEPNSNHQNSEKILTSATEHLHSPEVHSVDDVPCKTHLLNFHIIPLQTNLMKNSSRANSGEESDDLVNKFSSLHISENKNNYTGTEEPKNKNEYSPSRSSPRYSPNTYYTLPNRRSKLQDLERNVLERDIAMARDRCNIYSSSRNIEPSPPESQDVFLSPTFSYDNLNYSSGYDFMHFQEHNKPDYNINNNFVRDGGIYKKNSLDEGLCLREDLPSIYKSKSFKDLSQRKSYKAEDISPRVDYNTSPPADYHFPICDKNNDVINRPRPSYCSEFVQKKMKPINAKKFSFSSNHSGQESVSPRQTGSYGDTVRNSDSDLPPVFYSPNDNYPSHVSKHFGKTSPKDHRNDSHSNLYRSKSMKTINTEGQENFVDYKRKSDGSFSSKSYGGTLRSKSPSCGDTWNRTFSAENLDENDNWPVSQETNERKPVCTSKSLDYGIFGKEQQEAILNNVKRTLTEGRLWRPSFLKHPGVPRTEEFCSSQEVNPVGHAPDEVPRQGPHFKHPFNIYEDEPVVPSDSDTDTTTDDEYYLDENDKESEL